MRTTSKVTIIALLVAFATSGQLSCACPPDLWGYINKSGKWVIPPRYEYAGAFQNGSASVSISGDKAGSGAKFINTKGDLETPQHKDKPQQQSEPSNNFSDGLRAVALYLNGKSLWQYVDKSGAIVIPPEPFNWAGQFHDGLAHVTIGTHWYYIDKTGNRVISLPNTVSRAGDFHRGIAPVAFGGRDYGGGLVSSPRNGAKWGFINQQGKVVIEPTFDARFQQFGPEFAEGLSPVLLDAGNGVHAWGYIDETGHVVIKPQFKAARKFSEGLAPTCAGHIGFDPDAWKSCFLERENLLVYFFWQYKLIGMTPSLVHQLLGKPDETSEGPDSGSIPNPLELMDKHPRDSYLISEHPLVLGLGVSSRPENQALTRLEVEYVNEKVRRYRLRMTGMGHSETGPWVDDPNAPYL